MPNRSTKSHRRSAALFGRATRILPGGVDSPVRAFKGVGGTPLFIERARGAYLRDADGHRYIDYVQSWGPLILGHAPAPVVRAIRMRAGLGTSFGAPSALETALGEEVARRMPSIERIRFVTSGTEATMSAIRLARAFTGRSKILKFEGCYHGHADPFLVKAGSGATTLGISTSPGVPARASEDTLTAPYNDLSAVEAICAWRGREVAAIIVEPVAGNMGVVAPRDGFLAGLRTVCDVHGIVLIFDEVMTGFRVARGGAQERYAVRPDLTCLGKIIGGGLPVGAYGGRRDLMDLVAPAGPVYQAGTLAGNPLAMAAGHATLARLTPAAYRQLERAGARLERGLIEAARGTGAKIQINRVGSMLTVFCSQESVTDYASALRCDAARYARFFHAMLDRGVYLAPSQFEAAFVSLAHRTRDIHRTIAAARESFAVSNSP